MFSYFRDLFEFNNPVYLYITFGFIGIISGFFIAVIFYGFPYQNIFISPFKSTTPEKVNPDPNKGIKGLGYLGGVQKAPEKSGVLINQSAKNYDGYNLYVSGHAPEAYLVDMKGNVLHKWECSWTEAFPETSPEEVYSSLSFPGKYNKPKPVGKTDHWRNAVLLPDGSLVAMFSYYGLVRLDTKSNVVWSKANKAHHDLSLTSGGKIYTITADKLIKKPNHYILEDNVTILNQNGEQQRSFSLIKTIFESGYSGIFQKPIYRGNLKELDRSDRHLWSFGDVLHTNTIEIIKNIPLEFPVKSNGLFALVSFNSLNTIGLVNISNERYVWSMTGLFNSQHDPTILESGNILLFDNNSAGQKKLGWSRILEINPKNQKIDWVYQGNSENDLYSKCCSTVQRLPNGNTLITETEGGRALEVTPKKEVVWTFVSPHRVGNNNQKIAQLFSLKRFSNEYFKNWNPKK